MKTVTEHIRQHLLEQAGIIDMSIEKIPDLDELKKTEWSDEFERLQRNRLIMGRFRYGKLGVAKGLDRTGSIEKRIFLYNQTGNAEHLVDIANIAMMEFVEENHPNFHFKSQDDGFHDLKTEDK